MSFVTTLLQHALKAQEVFEKERAALEIRLCWHSEQAQIMRQLLPLEGEKLKASSFLDGAELQHQKELCFFNYMNSIWSEMSAPTHAYYDTIGCFSRKLRYSYQEYSSEITRLRGWLKDVQELDLDDFIDLDDLRHELAELEEKHARVSESGGLGANLDP